MEQTERLPLVALSNAYMPCCHFLSLNVLIAVSLEIAYGHAQCVGGIKVVDFGNAKR